jgi:large subunit ribosomal protein L18
MNHQKAKERRRLRRRRHVRRNLVGTPERPRLTVFRSSKHIYAQLIDDLQGVTLASASSNSPELRPTTPYGGNVKAAKLVGAKLAEAAAQKGITRAAFDRGHYKFHGRVKALAEAANAAGLKCCEHKPGKKIKQAPGKAEAPPAAGKKEKGDKGAGKEKPAKEKPPKEKPPKEKPPQE